MMKFNNFDTTDDGFNINASSKVLDKIFSIYGRKCRKMLLKKGIITKKDEVIMHTNYNIRFEVKRGE